MCYIGHGIRAGNDGLFKAAAKYGSLTARITPMTGAVRDERRPFWILERPRPLEFHHGRPWFEGRLKIESGPERIETGWWDGRDVTRDYFVVSSSSGMRLWIYRQRRIPRRWFLHGVFG